MPRSLAPGVLPQGLLDVERGGAPRARSRTAPWLAAAALLSALVTAVDVVGAVGPPPWSAAARAAVAPTCHQRPERSFEIGGRSLACCARCSGLHAAGLLAWPLGGLLGRRRLARSRRALLGAAGAAAGVLLADVAAGMAWPAWDHAGLRLATGALAGALVLCCGAAACAAEDDERAMPEAAR